MNKANQFPSFKQYSSTKGLQDRLDFLASRQIQIPLVSKGTSFTAVESLKGNIEHYIGMAQIPIGLAGPLLVHGSHAKGEFYIPLATTEGALVASYHRGMKACIQSNGIHTACLAEGVQRSPQFNFGSLDEVMQFVRWVQEQEHAFHKIVQSSSNHALLKHVKTSIEGNHVILIFEYSTGDAAGQNMVTICTNAICQYIQEHSPVKANQWYIESNYSGDKKATSLSFTNVRGKKVTAEATITKEIVHQILGSTPAEMEAYVNSSTRAVLQSGSIGAQGHIANGLTALFIACGQDVACISESSIGLTRMQVTPNGDLYISVTLPSLIVGTVGGGTGLPTQKECLEMMDCYGSGNAKKFAEICAAVALAGELSIASAIASNNFTRAHLLFGRKK